MKPGFDRIYVYVNVNHNARFHGATGSAACRHLTTTHSGYAND